jgi:hypothetical protein
MMRLLDNFLTVFSCVADEEGRSSAAINTLFGLGISLFPVVLSFVNLYALITVSGLGISSAARLALAITLILGVIYLLVRGIPGRGVPLYERALSMTRLENILLTAVLVANAAGGIILSKQVPMLGLLMPPVVFALLLVATHQELQRARSNSAQRGIEDPHDPP